MEHLWAPWRITYIEAEKPAKCILCESPEQHKDEAAYILFRGARNYVMLNSFPYNPGHLLVAPYRHIATLEEMTLEERYEHFDIVAQAAAALRGALKPGGFNIGINAGRIAGAGLMNCAPRAGTRKRRQRSSKPCPIGERLYTFSADTTGWIPCLSRIMPAWAGCIRSWQNSPISRGGRRKHRAIMIQQKRLTWNPSRRWSAVPLRMM